MQLVILSLVLLLCPSAEARSTLDVDNDKQYPITKVVTLLRDMQAQLEKEAEEDEEAYDKMACWCKTNDKEKSQAIKTAQARVSDLETTIETSAASSGRLTAEIANHDSELAKSTKSLDQLTSIRQKQAKEFNAEEKDMLQSIESLGSALVIINKHHSTESQSFITEMVRTQISKHKMMLLGVITPHQRRIVNGPFVEFLQKAPKYTPQSTEIFGILKQMKETFEGNLGDSQKQEVTNAKEFEEQKSAKGEEIKAITSSLHGKRTQLSKSDMLKAQSQEDLQDTQNSLDLDQKFLGDLKERCQMNDSEWELRQTERSQEISAVVEAISILSADSARDQFSKTFNPTSFIQIKAVRNNDARSKAVKLLKAAAAKTGNPQLAGLALAAQLDAFTAVKQAIDNMVVELGEAKKQEVTKRDYCIEKINENDLLTEKETRKKSDSEMKIQGLDTTISELKTALDTLNQEIVDMNLEVKRAGEDREIMNKDFQQTIADQVETQKLLQKALTVLKAVYAKKAAAVASLLSTGAAITIGQAPPPGMKDRSKSGTGGGVLGLLTTIINDAKQMEAEATKDEQAEQKTYEKFVQDTNAAIAAKNTAVVNKSEDKATATQDRGKAQEDLEEQTAELESLGHAKADLGSQCNFLLKNFEIRQSARDEEIEALKQAKGILSGMSAD